MAQIFGRKGKKVLTRGNQIGLEDEKKKVRIEF